MVRRFVSRIPALVAFLSLAGAAAAQTGTITGKVTDAASGRPLASANVQAVSGARTAASAVTGEDGSYRLTGVAAGTYTVTATKIGFLAKHTDGVSVAGNATTTANFAMTEFAAMLNPIVTTASRGAVSEKILDAPASISVVSAERLGSKPVTTIAEFMRTVPGISVSTGGLVQSNTVSRGFNNAFSGAMLNLQDYRYAGVPSLRVNVPSLYTGTGEDIERIEVLNGPASALYGPNSANGVVHVITKSPFQSKGTTLSLDGGGRAVLRGAGRTAWVLGEKDEWGVKLSGEYLTGSEWPYTDPNEPAVWPSVAPAGRAGKPLKRDFDVRRYTGEVRLDYRDPNRDLENIFTTGYTNLGSAIEITGNFGAAQAKNWSYTNFQDRFRYKKFFAQVFWNGSNSGNAGPNDTTGTYYIRTGIPVVDKSTVLVGQVQQGFDFRDMRLVVGADYIATDPRSEGTIFGRNEGDNNIVEYGAYLHTTIPLNPKWDLVTALRGDRTDRLAGTQFSPRAALVHKYNASNNFRFTFSRAFNSPASFEYFLDQIVNPTQAPGFALKAIGNPPTVGWKFDRSCDATINTGICMRSPFAASASTPIASSAANAFPGFIAALPSIINGLPTLSAAQKAQLTGLLTQLNPILSALRPTPAQLGTVLNLGTTVTAASVTDILPLSASFNNTWELGYKGIIGERLRVAVDLWYQIRGGVGGSAGQANPLVLYDPASLGTYLVTNITAGLMAAGQSQAVALATAQAAAAGLVPLMAALPQGTLAFTNTTLANDPSIIATWRNGLGEVDVHGMDVAIDYQMNDNWLFAATYSNQDKIVFPEIGGINPLMSNSPKYRATGSARYTEDPGGGPGWGFDVTARYADAFPVNTGLLNTLGIPPNPAGTKLYPPIKAQTQFDLGLSYRFPGKERFTWALNVSNLLDNREPTYAGTPAIGRLMLTRVRCEF